MVSVGDTFIWRGNARKEHLYIALNSAKTCGGKVVVVNLTEARGGPVAMVLKVDQHPFIYKDSDVNFGDSFIADETLIESEITLRSAVPNATMDLRLVEQIARAALKHPAVERDIKSLLRQQ